MLTHSLIHAERGSSTDAAKPYNRGIENRDRKHTYVVNDKDTLEGKEYGKATIIAKCGAPKSTLVSL